LFVRFFCLLKETEFSNVLPDLSRFSHLGLGSFKSIGLVDILVVRLFIAFYYETLVQ